MRNGNRNMTGYALAVGRLVVFSSPPRLDCLGTGTAAKPWLKTLAARRDLRAATLQKYLWGERGRPCISIRILLLTIENCGAVGYLMLLLAA